MAIEQGPQFSGGDGEDFLAQHGMSSEEQQNAEFNAEMVEAYHKRFHTCSDRHRDALKNYLGTGDESHLKEMEKQRWQAEACAANYKKLTKRPLIGKDGTCGHCGDYPGLDDA